MGLEFKVADLEREIQAIKTIAGDFLVPGADSILDRSLAELKAITRRHDGPFRWTISEDLPVKTRISYGDYMPDSKGSLCVFGQMSFVWELFPVRSSGTSSVAKNVELEGLASTKITIFEGDPLTDEISELAMWRMEVGDANAPGSHFHVQVMGRDDDLKFPKPLDIPRLPGLFVSPFAVLEFAIAELFQDEWSKHAARPSSSMAQWRSIQAKRQENQLKWQLGLLSSTTGSPWASMKRAKPPANLFTAP